MIRNAERALNGYMSNVRKQRSGEGTNKIRAIREGSIDYETDMDLWPIEEGEPRKTIS